MTKESDDFVDRRKFARVNIHAIVQYSFPLDGNIAIVQARISDISEGGVLMVTPMEELRVDALIKMSFVMPAGRLATVEGKVHHTRILEDNLYQSGVEFLHLEEKDRLAIRKHVDSHPKK